MSLLLICLNLHTHIVQFQHTPPLPVRLPHSCVILYILSSYINIYQFFCIFGLEKVLCAVPLQLPDKCCAVFFMLFLFSILTIFSLIKFDLFRSIIWECAVYRECLPRTMFKPIATVHHQNTSRISTQKQKKKTQTPLSQNQKKNNQMLVYLIYSLSFALSFSLYLNQQTALVFIYGKTKKLFVFLLSILCFIFSFCIQCFK